MAGGLQHFYIVRSSFTIPAIGRRSRGVCEVVAQFQQLRRGESLQGNGLTTVVDELDDETTRVQRLDDSANRSCRKFAGGRQKRNNV